jgi:Fic family protein
MGLLKRLVNEFVDVVNESGAYSKDKFDKMQTTKKEVQIINIDNYKIDVNCIRRHSNYYKVLDLIMRSKILSHETMLSNRQIAEHLNISKSSANRQIQLLCEEGYLRRIVKGNSKRSIYYLILVERDSALTYRELYTPLGRRKQSKL